MSAEERRKVLEMVADGRISAEEATKLMRALDEAAEEGVVEVIEAPPVFESEKGNAPEFEEVRRRAFRFAMIPLWLGVVLTVLSAWGMFSIQQNNGLNFWFFCLATPLLLGILLIALGARGRSARWIYVNVDRSHQTEWPRNITIAFPLPLGLAGWFLSNFGSQIEGLKRTALDEILQGIALAKNMTEPLIVNVDDGENGEKVQVFIG